MGKRPMIFQATATAINAMGWDGSPCGVDYRDSGAAIDAVVFEPRIEVGQPHCATCWQGAKQI